MSLRARVLTNPFIHSTSSLFSFASSPCFSTTANSPAASTSSKLSCSAMARSIRIVVVGDVHNDWNLEEDAKALCFLQADLVLFTGDFGNENVDLVKSVSCLEIPKAAILGNHDAWSTSQFSQKKKDPVHRQLECLKEQHVGYRRLDFPLLEVSVVGGRPFSCGGDRVFRQRLLSSRYGVNDMDGSAKKIYKAALGTPEGHLVILLAHNGPTGLGSDVMDICGRDWVPEGGDYGDPDLAVALSDLKRSTRIFIPLVVFGHMHKRLAYRKGLRKMVVVGDDNTVYLNGAIVPRVKHFGEKGATSGGSSREQSSDQAPISESGTLRAFSLVEIQDRKIEKISETWVSVFGSHSELAEETILYEKPQLELKSPI